jgi:cyanosortase A-associated protein
MTTQIALQHRLRTSMLILICFGVFAALGKLIVFPTPVYQAVPAAFELPADVPLPGWQLVAVRPLEQKPNTKSAQQRLLSSQLYEYEQGESQQKEQLLQIEMRYAIETSGNVMGFLGSYTNIPLERIQPKLRDERYQAGLGHYLILVNEQRTYLTSCINPRGESTVTLPQFRHNRYFNDVRIDRLWDWLLKSEKIRDDRCLWVNMSIPVAGTSPQAADSVLENAWVDWYRWWQPRFSKS